MFDLEVILTKQGLGKTTFRKELLELFHQQAFSLTVDDIRLKV